MLTVLTQINCGTMVNTWFQYREPRLFVSVQNAIEKLGNLYEIRFIWESDTIMNGMERKSEKTILLLLSLLEHYETDTSSHISLLRNQPNLENFDLCLMWQPNRI